MQSSPLFSRTVNYLETRRLPGAWNIAGTTGQGFAGAVVIPALAESTLLFRTLETLAHNPAEALSRFLILVVVNNRPDSAPADRADNQETLAGLAKFQAAYPQLQLGWIDAASAGFELPIKGGGVGLARKIGLDLALERLDYHAHDPILVCLDADTLVRPDYLPALLRHFSEPNTWAAIIHFLHQPGRTADEDRAIQRYELFLRAYVLGLSNAGSPYGFHTVGSAMACRASAYLKIGGMNNRMAGEDFYFLQQLSRTSGVSQVSGTVVYPSPRSSHRVPFGTGRSVSRLLAGEEAVRFYRPECYMILRKWLELVSGNTDQGADVLMAGAEEVNPQLARYLRSVNLEQAWGNLKKNNHGRDNLTRAFNGWFDGLKTMKLMHHLSDTAFPRCEPEEAMPGLLEWAGVERVDGMGQQLELLRRIQLGGDCQA